MEATLPSFRTDRFVAVIARRSPAGGPNGARGTVAVDDAIGGFDPSCKRCMDFDLLLRMEATGTSRHFGRTIGPFPMLEASKSSTKGLNRTDFDGDSRVVFLRDAFSVRRRYARVSIPLWVVALCVAPVRTYGASAPVEVISSMAIAPCPRFRQRARRPHWLCAIARWVHGRHRALVR